MYSQKIGIEFDGKWSKTRVDPELRSVIEYPYIYRNIRDTMTLSYHSRTLLKNTIGHPRYNAYR